MTTLGKGKKMEVQPAVGKEEGGREGGGAKVQAPKGLKGL